MADPLMIGTMAREMRRPDQLDRVINIMRNVFIPAHGLNSLIDEWLTSVLSDTNWLFVNLDSAYGQHLLRTREFLTPQLQKEQIAFWWEDEGLWLPGKELVKGFVIDKVIVTFSAAFIFPSAVTRCLKPKFNDTTDQGEFTDVQLKAVNEEIDRIMARAYVADGCGLQCIFADEDFYRKIRERKS
jgi:hypothetical protein